jgi:hypothetical protein
VEALQQLAHALREKLLQLGCMIAAGYLEKASHCKLFEKAGFIETGSRFEMLWTQEGE